MGDQKAPEGISRKLPKAVEDDTEGHGGMRMPKAVEDAQPEGLSRKLPKAVGDDDDTEGHGARMQKIAGDEDEGPDGVSKRLPR